MLILTYAYAIYSSSCAIKSFLFTALTDFFKTQRSPIEIKVWNNLDFYIQLPPLNNDFLSTVLTNKSNFFKKILVLCCYSGLIIAL